MPRTSLTTNGHKCNILYLIQTCSHSLTQPQIITLFHTTQAVLSGNPAVGR